MKRICVLCAKRQTGHVASPYCRKCGPVVSKAQFSRWLSGTEGILWPKLENLMDKCGNDAPVLWMLHQRGYDLTSLRRRESETERLLREKTEALRSAEEKLAYAESLLKGRS